MTALRVILDRSAFHGGRFDAIKTSRLQEAVEKNRIEVILTPVFLNETLTAYGSAKPSAWREHLSFALEVSRGRIFLDRSDIFHEEIVMGRGPLARCMMPDRANRRLSSREALVRTLQEVAAGKSLADEWTDTKEARDEDFQKSKNQERISAEIRAEIKVKLGGSPNAGDLSQYPFEQMRKSEIKRAGRELMTIVNRSRASEFAEVWARSPKRFPFYSAFVEGFLYNGYYAALEHYGRIDRNAQADYEQLAYLTWADVMVSNDTRFMRSAFDTLWRPRGKRFETAESFAALATNIA